MHLPVCSHREGWNRVSSKPASAQILSHPGPWRFSFFDFGECLPDHKNFVELDQQKIDAWGIPTLKIHCALGENELAAVGGKNIQPFVRNDPPGFAIHEMGTARMGRDPKTSVLNSFNQAHDVKNLFIADGAAMVSSSCVNPSLTYMALAARACDYAVIQMKKGEL